MNNTHKLLNFNGNFNMLIAVALNTKLYIELSKRQDYLKLKMHEWRISWDKKNRDKRLKMYKERNKILNKQNKINKQKINIKKCLTRSLFLLIPIYMLYHKDVK